jgi:hypothetical protein
VAVLVGAALATGLLLSACASTTQAPRVALEEFLLDVHAHSAVYAYTQLTNPAENATSFLPFFNGVEATTANFKVVGMKVVTADDVTATVEVINSGQAVRYLKVQMLEEGNAGDWLLNAPFATEGAKALKLLQ